MESVDPLAERVLDIALNLLKSKSEITVSDLVDSTGVKEAAIRNRLNSLVELNLLAEVKGIGRRPSYYFEPKPKPSCATTEKAVKALENVLTKLESQESELMSKLELVSSEKRSLQQSINILNQRGLLQSP